jgi:4-hydroxy-tetrahydrodipicolinate reductase
MNIRVIVAGATGWTGSEVTQALLQSETFELVGAIARKRVGEDIGTVLGLPEAGLTIQSSLSDILSQNTLADVLLDYTLPDTVKARVLQALDNNLHVVIGTSGLTDTDYRDIEERALARQRGVIAAGNFSITAALAKHFSLLAAQYLPHREVIDYAHAGKIDAPSGTTRELAHALQQVSPNRLEIPIDETHGDKAARGATVGETQLHSVRLPGYVFSFETLFGLPDERLSIRHDAGSGAQPYVHGTLLALKEVVHTQGLLRGLDKLMFR